MTNLKKTLSIVAFVSLGIFVLIAILWLINADIFENSIVLNIFISSIIFALASLVTLTPIELLKVNKILPLINICLTAVSSLLFLILLWTDVGANDDTFLKVVCVISIFAVLSTIVCSNIIKLKNKVLILQIACYCLILVFDVLVSLLVFEAITLGDVGLRIFIADILLCIASIIALAVIAKKHQKAESFDTNETITISVAEYNNLNNRIQELEKILAENQKTS